jgi:hypothetical protein
MADLRCASSCVTLADFVCHSQVIVCKNQEQMKMTTSAIPLIGLITLVSCANPPPQPAKFGCSGTDSPDHQLRACIVKIAKFPPPLNESRLDIRDTSGKVVASRNFGSPKGDQGRSVVHSAWTPDPISSYSAHRAPAGIRPGIGTRIFTAGKRTNSLCSTTRSGQ